MEVETFVAKTLDLIVKEREAEFEENRLLRENASAKELVRRGVCLLKLRIGEHKTGLYGRTVLKFEPFWDGKEFPAHNFSSGDIAGVSLSQGDCNEVLGSGIVSRVSQLSVSVAFEELPDSIDLFASVQYKLTKLANDVTHKRLKQALINLRNYRSGPSGQLINVLFSVSDPSPPISFERDGVKVAQSIDWFNQKLDDSQKEAVRFALSQRELGIIHGPPGTGKTTTVVEIIMQAIKQKLKILVCAPSNIAVDNLVERVAKYNKRIVRLGHPARLLSEIQKFSLDAILASSDESKLVADVRKDMDKTLSQMRKSRNHGEKQQLRGDIKYLRKELREREKGAIKGILNRAEVIFATLTGATYDGPLKHVEGVFDLVIIDECSQALEVACWIALLKGSKCVLAGDHNQLPPTILSHKAAKEGLEITLMERLLALYGADVMRMLVVQYRMHEVIMKWSSDQLYGGRLKAHESVARHLLKDLESVLDNENTSVPMLLIDTAGCYLNELQLPDEVSKGNEGEADLVSHHVNNLISSGLSEEEIAIITPYNLQVDFLRLRLSQKYPKLEIKSVDGFQGREKEAVILSLVRSNEKGEVGFLAEDRRINVAITRARRHVAVVCDSETVGHHSFLRELIDYMMENGEVRSAQQYIDDGALNTNFERPKYADIQIQESTHSSIKHLKLNSSKGGSSSTKSEKKKGPSSNPLQNRQNVEQTSNLCEGTEAEESEINQNEALQKIILSLIEDKTMEEHKFSSLLTSKERYLVHELAESYGLLHFSVGEGKERHIVIKKKGSENEMKPEIIDIARCKISDDMEGCKRDKKDKEVQSPNSDKNQGINVNQSLTQKELGQGIPKSNFAICCNCKKEMPKNNLSLHELRCKITDNSGKDDGYINNQTLSVKAKKKKKSKSTKQEEKEEDFDAIVQEAIQQNSQCSFAKCKTLTSTLGQICSFCSQRFCLKHHIPEVHGCGAQAKAHARTVIRNDGVLYRGSGVPDKKLDANKRAHLQRKLDKKLGELSDGRKIKKKDK